MYSFWDRYGDEVIFAAILLIGAAWVIAAVAAKAADIDDCKSRGGVYHCTTAGGYVSGKNGGYVTTQNCDCYRPDGTILLR